RGQRRRSPSARQQSVAPSTAAIAAHPAPASAARAPAPSDSHPPDTPTAGAECNPRRSARAATARTAGRNQHPDTRSRTRSICLLLRFSGVVRLGHRDLLWLAEEALNKLGPSRRRHLLTVLLRLLREDLREGRHCSRRRRCGRPGHPANLRLGREQRRRLRLGPLDRGLNLRCLRLGLELLFRVKPGRVTGTLLLRLRWHEPLPRQQRNLRERHLRKTSLKPKQLSRQLRKQLSAPLAELVHRRNHVGHLRRSAPKPHTSSFGMAEASFPSGSTARTSSSAVLCKRASRPFSSAISARSAGISPRVWSRSRRASSRSCSSAPFSPLTVFASPTSSFTRPSSRVRSAAR